MMHMICIWFVVAVSNISFQSVYRLYVEIPLYVLEDNSQCLVVICVELVTKGMMILLSAF